jgi:outer membrane lipoprotein-sorting protein
MKSRPLLVLVLAACSLRLPGQSQISAQSAPSKSAGAGQSEQPKSAPNTPGQSSAAESGVQQKGAGKAMSAPAPKSTEGLESVLDVMDRVARDFRSVQTDFIWDQYESVVQEHTKQSGVMYVRKSGSNLDMAADVTQPPDQRKYVLFKEGKVEVYQPGLDQVTTYAAGKNRDAFQSFLVLGFGGPGHDLVKQFDVKYAGSENVGGVQAAKLELVPKSQRVRGMIERILLWIDPGRGISVQQQFFEPSSGNYRLVQYSNIKINQKVPDSAFKLKTTGKTKFVNP